MQTIDASQVAILNAARPPRLLDQVRTAVRVRGFSLSTERTYVQWVRRFILWHGKRHPREMGAAEVQAYLNHLATDANVASSTQNQALAALLFLYRQVLEIDLPWIGRTLQEFLLIHRVSSSADFVAHLRHTGTTKPGPLGPGFTERSEIYSGPIPADPAPPP